MALKEFWKSVHICQSYDKKSSILFFWDTVTIISRPTRNFTSTTEQQRPIVAANQPTAWWFLFIQYKLTSFLVFTRCASDVTVTINNWIMIPHTHLHYTGWAKKWHPFGIWVSSLPRCIIFATCVYSRIMCIKWCRSSSADVNHRYKKRSKKILKNGKKTWQKNFKKRLQTLNKKTLMSTMFNPMPNS